MSTLCKTAICLYTACDAQLWIKLFKRDISLLDGFSVEMQEGFGYCVH